MGLDGGTDGWDQIMRLVGGLDSVGPDSRAGSGVTGEWDW